MNLEIKFNGTPFKVQKASNGDVTINEEPISYRFEQINPDRFIIFLQDKTYEVEILQRNDDFVQLKVNQKIIDLEIKDELDQLLEKLGMNNDSNLVIKEIISPMPGTILDIMVKEGQPVEKGDPIMILEAMKMENIIKSPQSAVVKHIQASTGQNVIKGEKLIMFE